ncbi:MAG: DUF1257 domain-containing protein [Syntrophaceae bacterium]|nr:DUF1257 domain-containing protein [Syntrophaceae bacterium]
MSMTVHVAMKGITDLELLIEALKEMGLSPQSVPGSNIKSREGKNLAYVRIDGNLVKFIRNIDGELEMKGDSDWNIFRGGHIFQQRVKQFYTVASIKRKAKEKRYRIASLDIQEDGSIKLVARAWG